MYMCDGRRGEGLRGKVLDVGFVWFFFRLYFSQNRVVFVYTRKEKKEDINIYVCLG